MAVVVIMAAVTAQARNNYSHDASILPATAKSTLKANFKAPVSLVKIDKDFGRISEYEVILTDGTEVTFDRDGKVKEVETAATSSVPAAFIPQPVNMYVKKYHSGLRVVGYEKKRSGCEITLSNGLELKFDKNNNFVKYDD